MNIFSPALISPVLTLGELNNEYATNNKPLNERIVSAFTQYEM